MIYLATLPSTNSLIQLFLTIAILALVGWGIMALIKSMGWTIPQPVWIVFTVLIGIFLILWLARIFGYAI